jgi:cytoskeletal protein RodZ
MLVFKGAQLISIGTKLSETREKLDKSLKDAEKETKIRSKYLEALEANKFTLIPGDAYVKIFIREYANFLNIDPAPLIKEYEEKHENSSAGEKFAPISLDAPKKKYPIVLSLLGMALLAGVIILWQTGWLPVIREKALIDRRSGPAKTGPAAKPEEEPQNSQAEKEVKPQGSASGSSAVAPAKQKFTVQLTISGQEGSDVKVLVDGELKTNRYLGPGEVREWYAQDKIELTVSNPSVVSVKKDGVAVEGFSDAQGSVTKTFAP